MRNPLLVVSLVLLLCFTISCQNKAEKAELDKIKAQAKVEEQNTAPAKRYLEGLDSGDVEKALAIVDEVFVPDCIIHSAAGELQGIEKVKQYVKNVFLTWSDLHHPVEQIIATSDIVITRITFKAKQTGEFMGIPATGKQVLVPVIYIYRFEDGKVKEGWLDWDSSLTMMMQLGMELKPNEAEKK
jgi:predicted ester cyclase